MVCFASPGNGADFGTRAGTPRVLANQDARRILMSHLKACRRRLAHPLHGGVPSKGPEGLSMTTQFGVFGMLVLQGGEHPLSRRRPTHYLFSSQTLCARKRLSSSHTRSRSFKNRPSPRRKSALASFRGHCHTGAHWTPRFSRLASTSQRLRLRRRSSNRPS